MFRLLFVSETAQVELKSGRVLCPGWMDLSCPTNLLVFRFLSEAGRCRLTLSNPR